MKLAYQDCVTKKVEITEPFPDFTMWTNRNKLVSAKVYNEFERELKAEDSLDEP